MPRSRIKHSADQYAVLAAVALCLATTVLLKMSLGAPSEARRSPALALVTLVPLLWLLAVTGTAAVQKISSSDPKIGFLAQARDAHIKLNEAERLTITTNTLQHLSESEQAAILTKLGLAKTQIPKLRRQTTNASLNALVTSFFLALVAAIFLISLREWILLLARKKAADLRETPPTWLPDYAVAEGQPLKVMSLIALALALAKELSGEARIDRIEQSCACVEPGRLRLNVTEPPSPGCPTREAAYLRAAEERFDGIKRCC